MFEAEEQRISIEPKGSKKVRFVMQKGDRVLTSVGITDGGDHARFGQMVLGNEIWDLKPAPWPVAVFFNVEMHNDGDEWVRDATVQAWHRGKDDSQDLPATQSGLGDLEPLTPSRIETARIGSPGEVLHTIRIRIRKGGAVDGDLDGEGPIHPSDGLTTDGQCLSVIHEALLRIIALDQDRRFGKGRSGRDR